MSDLTLPPQIQEMLKLACERAYRKGIRRGKRIGHSNGHAAGRDELIAGLKAVAALNGSAPAVMRVTKAFDESQHPRNEQGEFTKGEDIKAAAKDPAKRKELEAGMDAENKAKLAKAIEAEGVGKAEPGLTSASSAREGAVALDKLAKAFKAKETNEEGWQKRYGDAITEAADEIGKLSRDELTKLKEAMHVKAGGRKAEIARKIATQAIAAGHTRNAAENLTPEAPPETAAATPPPEPPATPPAPSPEPNVPPGLKKVLDFWQKVADSGGSPKKVKNALRTLNALRKGAGLPPVKKPSNVRPETAAAMGHGEGQAAAPVPSGKPPETTEDKYARSDLKAFADGKPLSPLAVHDETAKALRGEYGEDIRDAVTSITAHPEQYNTLKKKQDAIRRTLSETRMPAPDVAAPASPPKTDPYAQPAPVPMPPGASEAVRGPNGDVKEFRTKDYSYRMTDSENRARGHVLDLDGKPLGGFRSVDTMRNESEAAQERGPAQAADIPHYVTGGNTYQHRKALFDIGAKWDIQQRRWVLPKSAIAKLPPGLRGVPL